jgi:phage antirepressor YoqD-like protein
MNQLIATQSLTMSSREIAELTNKRHDNVLQLVRKLESDGILTPEFQETNHNGRMIPFATLGKRDSMVLVARLSPEFTAAIVDRWQELESKQAPQLPATYLEALEHLVSKEKLLLEQAPKVAFVDKYVESAGNKGFRQVCKLLKANETEFRAFLSDKKIMYRLGSEWVAYQNHIDAGRFSTSTGEGNGHVFNVAKFTPKGIQWVEALWSAKEVV